MKAATIFRAALGPLIIPFLFFCLILSPQPAWAEDSDYPETSEKFSREELAQMLAPIALYPDTLLSQVLMASTYPIEVVEADRWVAKHPDLKGEDLDAVLLDMEWDPSVKAVCHFPSILNVMSERISETTDIGNAFLAQEADVMGMVQELRAKAHAQNNLTSDSRQKVIVEKETIIIEPADPKVIYVSYYDPAYIYGPWWYPAYPPHYWGPPGVSIGGGISYWPGFYFGFAFGGWSYFDWHHRYIYIDAHKRPRFVRHERWRGNPGRWLHAPGHRRGVVYRDASTARRYGQHPQRSRDFRRDTRGVPEHRDQGPDRRGDDRTRIDPNRRGDDRTRIDRDKPGGDRTKKDLDRQERERIDRGKQTRERVDGDKQKQQRIDRGKEEPERTDRDRRIREHAERDRQGRERVAPGRKEQEGVDGNKQKQQRIDRGKQEPQRVEPEPEQEQKSRNNVFNHVDDDGRMERQSSERGRGSRQGTGDDSRDKGRSDDTDRGRNRR